MLMDERWDVAIILDACRFDAFEKLYGEFLKGGRLEKRPGFSETVAWLKNTFTADRYPDIVYVSACPYINSMGVKKEFFNAKEKFAKVYDVWNWGWDKKLKTVLPQEVTAAAIQARVDYPHKRLIVHYMQPHLPYRKAPPPQTKSGRLRHFIGRHEMLRLLAIKLLKMVGKYPPKNWTIEYYKNNFTVEQLKELYEDNLRWVLNEVKKLLRHLNGQIVITADHGEAFGERGEFFHSTVPTSNPVVREVPFWTAVYKTKKMEEQRIKRKIKELKLLGKL